MIGKLRGVVDSVEDEALILDVNGVGYLVSASARTLRALPAVGRGGGAPGRDPRARRRDQALRLPHRRRARLVSPAAKRAGGRRQGGARHSRRLVGGSAERRHIPAGQGDDGPRPGRRPEARRPAGARAQGQGAGFRRRRFRRRGVRLRARARSSRGRPRTRSSPSSASATPIRKPPPRSPGFRLSSDKMLRPRCWFAPA